MKNGWLCKAQNYPLFSSSELTFVWNDLVSSLAIQYTICVVILILTKNIKLILTKRYDKIYEKSGKTFIKRVFLACDFAM